MEKQIVKEKIEKYLKYNNSVNKEINKLADIFPNIYESELVDSMWLLIDIAIENLATVVGINNDDLSWFIFDNAQGANELDYDGVKIKNLDDFLEYFQKND